jgi:hypothetical protein
MRSVVRVAVFAVLLLCVAAAILAFAHGYANLPEGQRCAASVGWLGCAMAAHESLAGGLLGSVAVLIAALVAYEAIQQQIARDREAVQQQLDALRRREEELAAERAKDQSRRDEDAKLTAIMLIRNAIHISAVILRWLRQASDAKGSALTRAMQQVHFGVRQLQGVLDQRSLMEVASRLGAADRSHYVAIATNLTAFVNLAMYPPPGTQWDLLNATQREHLEKLRPSIEALDEELAAVFERDSDFASVAA